MISSQLAAAELLTSKITQVSLTGVGDIAYAEIDGKIALQHNLDPITISIITSIATALLEKAGAWALKEIFGPGMSSEAGAAILRKLVDDISDVIKRRLEEDALRTLTSRLKGIGDLFEDYMTSPETSSARLDYIINETAGLARSLEDLLPISSSAYVLCTMVGIAAVQEHANNCKTDEQREKEYGIVRNAALRSLAPLRSAAANLIDLNDQLIGPIYSSTKIVDETIYTATGGQPRPRYSASVFVAYDANGSLRSLSTTTSGNYSSTSQAEREADRLIAKFTQELTILREGDMLTNRSLFNSRLGIQLTRHYQSIEAITKLA